jgi:hypothetical protein
MITCHYCGRTIDIDAEEEVKWAIPTVFLAIGDLWPYHPECYEIQEGLAALKEWTLFDQQRRTES